MRFASEAQYGRTMRFLTNAPLAPLNDPAPHAKLADLHPTPEDTVTPLPTMDLPPAPTIDESAVFRAVRSIHPHPAAGPDHMTPRILHILVTSPISLQARVTGLSALTHLVRRLSGGYIPDASLPLLVAATLLSLKPRPGKTRPIAIGQVIRRVVMKTLLPTTLEDSREYFQALKKAQGIPAGMVAIVHDARMITNRYNQRADYVLVSVDASKAFNRCSRQCFLDALPDRAPTFARFRNRLYASSAPPLFIPASPSKILLSSEGAQQGDPPSMLLFSLSVRKLFRQLEEECDLALHVYYADDGTLAGSLAEVKKALQLLQTKGPEHQFYITSPRHMLMCPPQTKQPSQNSTH